MDTPQDLLTDHEARSLERSIIARIVVLCVILVFAIGHLLDVVDPGVIAETDTEALTTGVVIVLALLALARGRSLARRRAHLQRVGSGIVALDILVLSALPLMWLTLGVGVGATPAFLLKNELFTISAVFIVINALSLQPRFPAIMSGGAVLLHLAVLAYVMADGRVHTADSYQAHFNTPAVNLGIVTVRIATLIVLGATLFVITRNARRLVHDAVDLQVTNAHMREQQAQLIMEGRMRAMASLVAGVAHELNTPLGAVSGSLQTVSRAAERLQDAEPDPARRARSLRALTESAAAGAAAVERLSKLVASLKDFASLDQAEVQQVDLHDGLDSALATIDAGLKGATRVEVEHGELPAIWCRPNELNQVFRTLLVNGFEALAGGGTLRIRTRAAHGQLQIEIDDDGPGMEDSQVESLFELRIGARGERMGMGLGLLTSRRIVERHGGTLNVTSQPGRGTTCTITLPAFTPMDRGRG